MKLNNIFYFKSALRSVLKHLERSDKLSIVNNKNADGFTILSLAILNNNFDIVKLLLENDKIHQIIDINSLNSQLLSPLHIASLLQNLDIIELLLSANLDIKINGKDIKGNTPIHYLVSSLINQKHKIDHDSIFYKIAYLLLDHHADLTINNHKNQNPLDICLRVNNEKILTYNSKVKETYPDKCLICKINKRSILIKPCNHLLTCNLCASTIKECLICKTFVNECVQIEECLICFEKRSTVLFKPCEHIKACNDCFNKPNLKKCLKCRANIEEQINFSNKR